MSRILVLGATSRVAQEFSRQAVGAGHTLILGARNLKSLQLLAGDLAIRTGGTPAPCLVFDAKKFETHGEFVREVLAHGSLDGCFIACGVLHRQDECDTDWGHAEDMIDCNYTGLVSIVSRLVPHFAERRGGFISCISSVAGDRGRQSNYLYGSTKAGLNTYLEGLRHRLHAHGVLVQTVKLGPVDTPMNTGVERAPLMVSAESAARDIWQAIRRRRTVVYVPGFWRGIMLAIRLLPERIFHRTKL